LNLELNLSGGLISAPVLVLVGGSDVDVSAERAAEERGASGMSVFVFECGRMRAAALRGRGQEAEPLGMRADRAERATLSFPSTTDEVLWSKALHLQPQKL